MTDVASPEMLIPAEDWDQEREEGSAFPEVISNPHNHTYTWSPKLPDGSMLVVRSQTPQGLVEAVEAMAPAAARLRMAWLAVTGTPPAPQAPAQAVPAAMQSQPNYNPVTAPPGQPYPGQPAWQQAGAPQAQAAPQWGAPQQGQAQQRKEYPAPQGWYKLAVPFPGGKDQLHALAAQLGIPKGNPAKGGVYNFFGLNPQGQPGKAWYCAPDPNVLQAFAQFAPMVG